MSDMPEWVLLDHDPEGGFSTFSATDDSQKYIRADLVPAWNRDMRAAPAGKIALLATKGGYVGEAMAPIGPEYEWVLVATGRSVRHTPIAWMTLPEHPDGGEE